MKYVFPTMLLCVVAGCEPTKIEQFDAHVVEFYDVQQDIRYWFQNFGYRACDRFAKEYGDRLTWTDDGKLTFVVWEDYGDALVECFCNEVAAVNCQKTLMNHPVWEWPKPWIKEHPNATHSVTVVTVVPAVH